MTWLKNQASANFWVSFRLEIVIDVSIFMLFSLNYTFFITNIIHYLAVLIKMDRLAHKYLYFTLIYKIHTIQMGLFFSVLLRTCDFTLF